MAATEKQAPPLFRRHVRRPRLTRLLDESTAQAIVLNAPAGYGKTTLAREWLQGRERVAWYRATPGSADVSAFSIGLASAIRPLVDRAGSRLEQRVRVADAPGKAAKALAELLAEDLLDWPEDAVVVIDDYHLVMESSPVEEFVDWLLTLSTARFLVTTRRRPGWASARRELYGEITEITREQLAMRSDEAETALANLSMTAAHELVRSADGWPALIGLAALTAASNLPEERVSDALYRFFAEEVLRKEEVDVQEFLLLSSVLPSINVASATDLLGCSDPERFLSHLHGEGLLVMTDPRPRFRLHPLLRDFLRRKLESTKPRLASELGERATAVAIEEERWDDAFELAIQVGRVDLAELTFGRAARKVLMQGRVETVEKWMAACEPLTMPEAKLAKVELLERQGHPSAAGAIARDVANTLESSSPLASRAWALAGRSARSLCDFEEALECEGRARDLADGPSERLDASWGAFIAAAELERDDLQRYLADLESLTPDDVDGQLRLAAARLKAADLSGTLKGAWRDVLEVLPQLPHATDVLAKSNLLANISALAAARADFQQAHDFAVEATQVCEKYRLAFAHGFCLIRRGRAEVGLNLLEQAERTLIEVNPLVARSEDPYLKIELALVIARLELSRDQSTITRSLRSRGNQRQLPAGALAEALALEGLSEVARGDIEQGLAYSNQAAAMTRSTSVRWLVAFAVPIAHLRSSKNEASTSVSEQTTRIVRDAVEAECFEALVVAYRAFPPLLGHLASDPESRGIVIDVLARANDLSLGRSFGIQPPGKTNVAVGAGLTARELEVMELLTEGLSNAAIAEKLYISVSTTKVHIHRILHKLGAKTRLHAVVRWNEVNKHAQSN